MNNYNSTHQTRRLRAHVSLFGTSQLHLRNPYVIAWWSAAFPGFGHMLLSKHLRGFLLFTWEVVINYNAKINLAMVYSFCGEIELAKASLDTRWMLMYIPVYLFGIWDSYRSAVDMNKSFILANREDAPFNTFCMGSLELNYLEKRVPLMAALWSIFMPGLGQLYLHQIVAGFFTLVWSVVFLYFSHILEAIQFLFLGDISGATAVLDIQWFLFIFSVYGYVIIDSYINAVENNKLFDHDQTNFLIKNYQSRDFKVLKGKVVH
jgi:TM2 domain-containing membrane protein YozV